MYMSQPEINYTHTSNTHTLEGPRMAIPIIFINGMPQSVLDVGCGRGTWLASFREFGVSDIYGVDGVDMDRTSLLFPPNQFLLHDLTTKLDLGRKFDTAVCLEVAEHLDEKDADTLIETLTRHTDTVLFSAACPRQPGQHHVNCQWPDYWQNIFNSYGFTCSDAVRWRVWNTPSLEPWYRQNMFQAKRNPAEAGKEERIRSVIHPDVIRLFEHEIVSLALPSIVENASKGSQSVLWYIITPFKALWNKLARRL